MRRLRLWTLMALILVLGLALGLAIKPTPIGNAFAFTASLFAVLVAAIGAIAGRGRVRARCQGFVTLAGGYLLLGLGPWCNENVEPHLVSSQLIDRAYDGLVIGPPIIATFELDPVMPSDAAVPPRGSLNLYGTGPIPGRSRTEYRRLGHSILALLAGAAGALIADRFARRGSTSPADYPPSADGGSVRGSSAETTPSASSIV